MLQRATWLGPLTVAVVAALAAGTGAGAPARIVDRTFVCTPTVLYGGVRDLDVKAIPEGASYVSGARSTSTGYIGLSSGQRSADLVFARARLEQRYQSRALPPGVYVDVRRCARARSSQPLSPIGLSGPPVEFGTDAECEIRGRVLVRVRALLEAPTSWRPADRPYAGARRNVVEAKIAVRSERTRKPLGFIELDPTGKTKLWSSSGCG